MDMKFFLVLLACSSMIISAADTTPTAACPKYVCGSMKTAADCLEVDGTDKAKMTATGQVCNPSDKDKKTYCNVSGITDFGSPAVSTCGVKDVPTITGSNNRYPNEPCDANFGCIQTNAKCPDGQTKCPATTTVAGSIRSDADCNLGQAFWDIVPAVGNNPATPATCKDQLALNDATCLLANQCKNSQGCLIETGKTVGKCTDYFSLKIDTASNDAKLCISGAVNSKGKCDHSQFAYDGQTPDGTSNLVACKPGDQCKYAWKDTASPKSTIPCTCTLSKDGFAWCPIKYDESAAGWTALATAKKAKYGYDCHTLRRGICTEMFSDANNSDLAKAGVQTSSFHIFYNAEGCILTIFGDSSRIRMGVFGVISMIFAWFML